MRRAERDSLPGWLARPSALWSGCLPELFDVLQLRCEPPGLIAETSVLGDGEQFPVAGGHVEASAVLELAQVNRAKVERPASLPGRLFEPLIRQE